MARTATERSVYRYFDLADSFVQILVTDAETLNLPDRPGLNRAGYRRLVIQNCMPEFRGDLESSLETLFPEDPLMVEDLLYQLCVEVNPALDIHEVRLCVEPESDSQALALAPRTSAAAEREDLLARLCKRAKGLERRLARQILGQNQAVGTLVRAVRKAAVGLGAEDRPLASFLLTGRTGTGKTELARTLATELFGTRENPIKGLVRIDCSEFALAHEYSKLIGSPPGYVGHEDGGQLTDAVGENPESIILFDEVEKAHPRMHNLLLQILEEGALTDGKGRRVSFARTMVLMTSNAGAEEMLAGSNALGFERARSLERGTLAAITHEALERMFSPEFLGRVDDTILFNELAPRTVEAIASQKLYELAHRSRDRGYKVAFTPAVARWVARRGFSPDFGARELRRVIQREVEPRLSELMLDEAWSHDELLRVRVKDGALTFAIES
ncbi:MAG: ATP-dependent Clp protease ATP-binding subunit [bacterium]|nr:ATP-dependent Clp protease ATP-binding subunit [bacterium]